MKSEQSFISISDPRRYRPAAGLATRKLGGEWVLVPTHRDAGDMDKVFSLNEVGAYVWNGLGAGETVPALIESVVAEFEVDEATAKGDVLAFLEALLAAGLIVSCDEDDAS